MHIFQTALWNESIYLFEEIIGTLEESKWVHYFRDISILMIFMVLSEENDPFRDRFVGGLVLQSE